MLPVMFHPILDIPRIGGQLFLADLGSEVVGIEQLRGRTVVLRQTSSQEFVSFEVHDVPTLREPVFTSDTVTAHFGEIDPEGVVSMSLRTGHRLFVSRPEAEFALMGSRVYVARHGTPGWRKREFVEVNVQEHPTAVVAVSGRLWLFNTFSSLHAYSFEGERELSIPVPWDGDIESVVVRSERIYIALPNGSVFRFDSQTRQLRRLFVGPAGPIALGVAADEQLIAVTTGYSQIKLHVFRLDGTSVLEEESVDALIQGDHLAFVRGRQLYRWHE